MLFKIPHNNQIVFCIAFIIFLLGLSSSYAETITYKDIIKAAIDNSPRIKVKREDINILEANYKQSVAGLFPEITLNSRIEKFENLKTEGGLTTIAGQVVGGQPDEWRTTLYLSGEYYLSNWYKRRHETTYYEKLKEASNYDCDIEAKKLLRELTDIYSALSEGRIKLKYSDEMLKKLREIHVLKKRSYGEGEISYEELLKTEAEIVNAEREQTNIQREIKEYLSRLAWYTGNTYGGGEDIEHLVFEGRPFPKEVLGRMEDTPEYIARQKELEAMRERLISIKNNFLPDISVYTRYDLYGSNTESLSGSFDNVRKTAFTAGVFATMPLFDGGRRKWERVKTTHEIRKQEENIRTVKEEKGRDVESLHISYSELHRTLEHYRKLMEKYRQMLYIAKKAHSLGDRSMIDVFEMEKDVLSIERDIRVTENSKAAIEKKLFLETDYRRFIEEFYGDRACKY